MRVGHCVPSLGEGPVATGASSQRRQVAVASVTRRSHAGQSADTRRLAPDQKLNITAGIRERQYTQGTLCSPNAPTVDATGRGLGSAALAGS